jgi:Family of unknown function (DUF6069)
MSTVAASLPGYAPSRAFTAPRFAFVAPASVVAVVVANAAFYYLAGAVVAYDSQFLPLANVSGAIIFTLFPALVAVPLYAALRRFTRQPARIFTIVSAIVLVLSIIPDLTYIPTVPGVTDAQITVLILMHVVAAAVIVRMLTLSRGRN